MPKIDFNIGSCSTCCNAGSFCEEDGQCESTCRREIELKQLSESIFNAVYEGKTKCPLWSSDWNFCDKGDGHGWYEGNVGCLECMYEELVEEQKNGENVEIYTKDDMVYTIHKETGKQI